MCVVRFTVMQQIMRKASIGMEFQLTTFDFLLLIISVLAITAAGNIINDYFDQKVDRINKPDRVMVGKTVKRRLAIVLHQGLNILGFLASAGICLITNNWWPILIPVFIITALWWYSPVLKKRVFVGNFTVALCTASVPLWAAIFEIHELRESYSDLLVDANAFFQKMWLWIFAVCVFAFILTLIREAIKDMEDMEGDREGDYHTIPLVFGASKTKSYIYVLLSIFLVSSITGIVLGTIASLTIYLSFAILILLPSIYVMWTTRNALTQNDYKKISRYLKLITLGGLVMIYLAV